MIAAMNAPIGTNAAIIIPARLASTRYPGKPLATLRGGTGVAKSLLARSIDAARLGSDGMPIWVATDNQAIADQARANGVDVAMTPSECRNGTERCAAALSHLPVTPNFIVNFQGDALLTPPKYVSALISHMRMTSSAVATVAMRCSQSMLNHLIADRARDRVGGTTAVVDRRGRALYFSKHVLPFGSIDVDASPVLLHLGLYAYRPDALAAYAGWPMSAAEAAEGLEQLRFLDNGVPVDVVTLEPPGWDPVELNNPSDIAVIEAVLAARGLI